MTLERKIIHVDMDAFYASVEQLDQPHLKGKPIVVGGRPETRGVVASASYEARKFGVRSAMSCNQAKRLCPRAIFLYPRFERYHQISGQIQSIFTEITPLVEPLSLDEAYLDVTKNLLNEPLARKIAALIKKRIRDELGLSASAGVGPNKFIAKLASDHKKPDGLVVVPPEKVPLFIKNLPVEKFWGVGPATAKRLQQLGLFTAEDIRNCDLGVLRRAVGSYSEFLFDLAHGFDAREVEPNQEAKSRGTETTFDKDVMKVDALLHVLQEQAEELAEELIEMNRPARTISLKVRYSDFTTISRSRTLPRATAESDLIFQIASELLMNATDAGKRPIRLLGISMSGLIRPGEPYQLRFDF